MRSINSKNPQHVAIAEMFGWDKAEKVVRLLQAVNDKDKGMMLLCLAVADGHGENTEAFRSMAAFILSRSKP